MVERISLSGWEISGYFPYVPQLGMQEPALGRSITDWIPARVPGSVHMDLWRAGWIDDPYFGMNSMRCEWVENRWWAYRTTFTAQPALGQHCHLRFLGLDYRCHIYLNGQLLLIHEGSFSPVDLDITGQLAAENHLLIVFESAPQEDSQAGHASHTHTQKSRFSYKWDFDTRMVPVGIWDDAWVELTGPATVEHVRLVPMPEGEGGQVTVEADCALAGISTCAMRVTVLDGERVLAETTVPCDARADGQARATARLSMAQVERWQVNGMGAQKLYGVRIELLCGSDISHRWQGRIGFRDLRWEQNDRAPEGALPYCLRVNGRRVYIRGVNLTPFDMLIGTVSDERYRRFLRQIQAAGINLVRVNGVGLIEKERFYDLCDEYGILVWQEFIQTSSSMDRTPPTTPDYLSLLRDTSRSALRIKRNHACLACWCGGNELTDAPHVPATAANPNIDFLQRLVDEEDPGRMLFPASSSGPSEFLEFHREGISHDVHGPWHYVPEEHYALFNQSDSLLHGELGAEGMACVGSLKRFLSPADLTVTNMQENLVWRHHGDWWDTWSRDRGLVGELPDLDTFTRISQLFQWEGIRYALVSNRQRKFHNSGSIMWAYTEPYPNVSNTCLVDYYGVPKLSYYAAHEAYRPLLMSLRYDGQVFTPGETLRATVWLNSGLSQTTEVPWRFTLHALTGEVLSAAQGCARIPGDSAAAVGEIAVPVQDNFPEVLLGRLTYGGTETQVSEYLFSTHRDTPFSALVRPMDVQLSWQELPGTRSTTDEREETSWRVVNRGTEAALLVYPELPEEGEFIQSMDGVPCLLPGEERLLRVVSWSGNRAWASLRFRSIACAEKE